MNNCSSETVNQDCKLSISFKFMVGQQHQSTVSPTGCSLKTNFCYYYYYYYYGHNYILQTFKVVEFLLRIPKYIWSRAVSTFTSFCQLVTQLSGLEGILFNVPDLEENVMLYYEGHQMYSLVFRHLHLFNCCFLYWNSFCQQIRYCYFSGICSLTLLSHLESFLCCTALGTQDPGLAVLIRLVQDVATH